MSKETKVIAQTPDIFDAQVMSIILISLLLMAPNLLIIPDYGCSNLQVKKYQFNYLKLSFL